MTARGDKIELEMPSSSEVRWAARPWLSAMIVGAALVAEPTAAVEIGGSLRLLWTDTDFDSRSSRNSEQQFSLDLRQELSPFLTVRVRSRLFDLETREGGDEVFSRRFRQPSIDLLYSHPSVSARVSYDYRLAEGTADRDNFEAWSANGSLLWRMRPDLTLNLSFRDEINESDIAALGRDIENRQARALLLYRREYWTGSYSYAQTDLENRSRGLKAEQYRHDLRLDAARDFLDRKLSLSFSGDLGRSRRRDVITDEADLAEPVPAAAGLFALDLTPELGELEPASGLIDGDFVSTTTPVIEIGGANTYRNIGLDLGFTREISRLEIAVDRPSSAAVGWEVYRSRDNLFWERVLGSQAEYDGDRLRYALSFPPVEDRFFKVVNVSINSEVDVSVTELRALRDLPDATDTQELDLDLYQVTGQANLVLSSRVRARVGAGSSNDDSRVADLVIRDRQERFGTAGLDVDLSRTLRLSLGHRWADERDGREPGLDRTTDDSDVSLTWTPLETVDAVLSASQREESNAGELLQQVRSSRLAVGLQLLRDLRLYSEVSASRLDDPFSGFDRETLWWSQRLETRPLPAWRLAVGYSYLETETPESEQLLERTDLFIDSNWALGSYLTMNATWRLFEDAIGDSLRQTYGLFYAPGPKISLTASWEEIDSDTGRLTGNESVGLSYRLYRRVFLSARLSRSRSASIDGPIEEITTGQTGLRIRF